MRRADVFKIVIAFMVILSSCGSKSNKRAVKAEDLDKIMEEENANAPTVPVRSTLSASEFIQLSECGDISCVQLFMKEKTKDFFYARKGEYYSNNRGIVVDSADAEKIMAFSTLYFASEPSATWRIAHIIHKKELADTLLDDFNKKGFMLADSIRYYATQTIAYRYTSELFPGAVLYYSSTYKPWYGKGIYLVSNWKCYVFEVQWR
ncbi:MAG TPA: hypothetical protein PKC72_10330 [Chitinophagaceae bacterium]|nr:hypothetical protein [Chitinophagaceae bacterium]